MANKLMNKALLVLQAFSLFSPQHVSAQQFVGDVIPNSLLSVPGSEKAFWRITDKKDRNFTQINYFSQDGNGKRLKPSNVQRVVIFVHGANRDPGTYMSNLLVSLSQVRKSAGPNFTNTQIIAPYFPNGEDKVVGYPWDDDAPKGGYGSTSSSLVWSGNDWMDGGNNQYPRQQIATSSFDCIDQIIQYFADKTLYPNVKQIVVGGHSAGAQFVQRYAAAGYDLSSILGDIGLTYWVGNPNSYVWLNSSRPIDTTSCPDYDDWKMGLANYQQSYNKELFEAGIAAVQANYNSKSIAYVRGLRDRGDTSNDCTPFVQGQTRDERFFAFIKEFPPSCAGPADPACDTIDYINIGHDAGSIFASPAGQARLFIDNFNGDKDKRYDFFCPRIQDGDSPFPNPDCDSVRQPPSGTYNGMTYQGCWTDRGPRSLTTSMGDNAQTTIDSCTKKCAAAGFALAGMEFGTQCYCGNSMTSQATQVVERGCYQSCGGDDSQVCGGFSRLSVWGTGKPVLNVPARNPPAVGDYKYAGCYKDNVGSKAMPVSKPGGNSLTLEKCAAACAGYNYFGTEYATECTCANALVGKGNVKTSDGDCEMTCAGDASQFCGDGNRLTLYSLKGRDVVYQGSGSGGGGSSLSGTAASPGSTPTSTPDTSIVCPGSNGQTYTSNGKTFTVQCGIDHAANDLKSLSTDTFAGCMDACAGTKGCVVLAYSGTACYLKNGVGTEVKNGVWGAIVKVGSSSSTMSSASTTSSSVSTTATSASTSAIPSSTPNTSIVCPASDGTTYTASGKTFTVQCGIDHEANDLKSVNTDTFAACMDACASTDGCIVLAYSGTACYMKNGIGAPVNNGVWGAIVSRTSSSSTSSTTISPSSSTSSSLLSVTSPTTASRTSSTSSATPRPTRLSCPASDGTTYTVASGAQYQIKCGVDHAGGDMPTRNPVTVNSLQACVEACGDRSGCQAVALSGVACYLKSSVGAEIRNGVEGAVLLQGVDAAKTSSMSLTSSASPISSTSSTSSSLTLLSTTSTSSSILISSATSTTASTLLAVTASASLRVSTSSTATIEDENIRSSTLSTAVKSSTSSARSQSTSTTSPEFLSLGCFNSQTRILTNRAYANSSNTPSFCAKACRNNGYKYSGVEYGNECWCGNTLPRVTAPLKECSYPCPGDSSEKCGAGNRVNVLSDSQWVQTFFARDSYKTWSIMSCYQATIPKSAAGAGNRTIPVSLISKAGNADKMTVAKCLDTCSKNGYPWCGLEWRGDCWASSAEPESAAAILGDPLDPTVGCDQPCGANSTESCGGWAKVLVYSNPNNSHRLC